METPSELWQTFLDEQQELRDRGYDSFTSAAQAFVNKVPNPHPCAESIKHSTSRQLVYIEQNRSIFHFWRHIAPKFFLVQIPYAVSRQHLAWSWDIVLALSKSRSRLWDEVAADTVFRSSATKADIRALASWREGCNYTLIVLKQTLAALSKFEDEGKEGQFGRASPRLIRSRYEHPIEIGQDIFRIVYEILKGTNRSLLGLAGPNATTVHLPGKFLLNSIRAGRIQSYKFGPQVFTREIVNWNHLNLDLDMGEDYIKYDLDLFKLKIEDMQELLVKDQNSFMDRLEACENGTCVHCKGVPSSTSDDS